MEFTSFHHRGILWAPHTSQTLAPTLPPDANLCDNPIASCNLTLELSLEGWIFAVPTKEGFSNPKVPHTVSPGSPDLNVNPPDGHNLNVNAAAIHNLSTNPSASRQLNSNLPVDHKLGTNAPGQPQL